MKKIIALVLTLSLLVLGLASCGAKDKEYTLSIVIDNAESGAKVTNTVCAVITDADGKIVAARFDAQDTEFKLDDDGKLVVPTDLSTKVDQGEDYKMPAGSWEEQANAYGDYIVGKTADEVKALDKSLVTGCTMSYTTPLLQTLVGKAMASEYKVTFTAKTAPTLGLAMVVTATGELTEEASPCKVTADAGAVAVVDGKIAASILDTAERTGSFEINEDDELELVSAQYPGSKAEQGEDYKMPAGSWVKQATAFCAQTVGLTKTTIADLAVTGDAMTAAGCTMQYTVYGYKTVLTKALDRA